MVSRATREHEERTGGDKLCFGDFLRVARGALIPAVTSRTCGAPAVGVACSGAILGPYPLFDPLPVSAPRNGAGRLGSGSQGPRGVRERESNV